jgi:hypothetical protein
VWKSTFDAFTGKTYFTFVADVVAERDGDGFADALVEALGEGVGAELGAAVGSAGTGALLSDGATNCGVPPAVRPPESLAQPARQTAETVKDVSTRSNRTGPSWQNPTIPADPATLATELLNSGRRGGAVTDGHPAWPATSHPPISYPATSHPAPHPAAAPMRPPSGLFPGLPRRPVYREPHPVHAGPLLAGLGAAVLWFALFGALGHNLATYAWWTVAAALVAWAVAGVLSLFGDRGVAVGIALTAGLGLSIAVAFVAARWITSNNWPLW